MDENEIKMDEDVMDETDIDEIDEDEDEDFDDVEEDDVDSSNTVAAVVAIAGAFAGLGGAIYYAHKKRVVKRAVAAVKTGFNAAKEAFKKSATDVDVVDTVKIKDEYIPVDDSDKKSTEK